MTTPPAVTVDAQSAHASEVIPSSTMPSAGTTPVQVPPVRQSPPPEVKIRERVAFIDALRGIAILGVLFIHTSEVCPPPTLLTPYIGLGARGVQLFYVISACTLFQSLANRTSTSDPYFIQYAIRRFFRIAPMFYVAVGLYILIDGFGPRFWAPNGTNWMHVLLTMLFINGWYPSTINSIVPGGWSVAIEMTFYLLVPALFLYVTDIAKAVRLFILITVGAYFIDDYATSRYTSICPNSFASIISSFCGYLWLPAQLSVFIEGVILYFLMTNKWLREVGSRLGSGTLLALVLFLVWCMDRCDELPGLPTQTLFGGVFILLAIALWWHPWKFLVNAVTVYIGRISFSMYLLHFAVIRLMMIHPRLVGSLGSWCYGMVFIGLLLGTVLLSSMTFRLIETPGQKLGKRLSRFMRRPSSTPAV
jgi:peptidoglycan/LPS O-acetylase OafA/YrhL